MHKTYSQIVITALLLALFSRYANAAIEIDWTEGNYEIPSFGWAGADLLNIYNDVQVTMTGLGGVSGQFNMFDNSSLIMQGVLLAGYISELNLYDNASAELYGGTIFKLYIDSESTAKVILYAEKISYYDGGGGDGHIQIKWLNDPHSSQIIILHGPDTYSHITIVPEPASITFIALGGLALLRRRSR